jgi:hypothetical protein
MTSNDPEIRKMMAVFEEEQAIRFGMHIKERLDPEDEQSFLRWEDSNPDWNDWPVAKLHSIFPRAFKAVQESDISVCIRDGKPRLALDEVESFTVSKYSRPAMWITQNVMSRLHAIAFNMKVMASRGWWDLEDNPASNRFLNWATSKCDDAILKSEFGIRLNQLKTPWTIKRDGDRDIQCCWCEEKNQYMAHIMCGCRKGMGWRYMNERHPAIVDAVKAAIREGIRGVHIQDDRRVADICAGFTDEDGALKRPDLMYESFAQKKGKTRKYYNLTEITCPWAWGDSLERAYMKKLEKYEPVRVRMQQLDPSYDDVRLNITVVSPSGVFLQRSKKDSAVATMLTRSRLAAHARFVVDAAITQAHEHYGAYCKAISLHDQAAGVAAKYTVVEKEFKEQWREMEVTDSIREVEVVHDPGPLAMEDDEITQVEIRRMSEAEQRVREQAYQPCRCIHIRMVSGRRVQIGRIMSDKAARRRNQNQVV